MYRPNQDLLFEAASILTVSGGADKEELREAAAILEDTESPVSKKFHEKLYKAVIDKKHIDWDDIPNTKGDFSKYKGYSPMMQTLGVLMDLAGEQSSTMLGKSVEIVQDAAKNLVKLGAHYSRGFDKKNEYVMMEYNTIAATCIEATTSLLHEFVDYMRIPSKSLVDIRVVNTKFRPNLFYIEQLKKYNRVVETEEYSKYLRSMIDGEKDEFTMYTALGVATVGFIAKISVPIIRELVYQLYNTRQKLSEHCTLQATFLEMNKARLEADSIMNPTKKAKVIKKQEAARERFMRLADKLRLDSVQANKIAVREIKSGNELININSIRDEINNSPLDLI